MKLTINDVTQDRKLIRWQTKKTSSLVSIPVNTYLKNIIDKYDGFPPVMCHQKFNYYVKEVCKQSGITHSVRITRKRGGVIEEKYVPKYTKVSAHSGRRSMATNLYLKGVPPHKIIEITGHKSISMLMRYIKVDSIKTALDIGGNWHE